MEVTATRRFGPVPGSEGAQRISVAHRGSHEHDRFGGFAGMPNELRQEAGRRGAARTMALHGRQHYVDAGRLGGLATKAVMATGYYAEIGRRGGFAKAAKRREEMEANK